MKIGDLVLFNKDLSVAHAELKKDAVIGEYNLVYKLLTKSEELPLEFFCYLPIVLSGKSDMLNSYFRVAGFVNLYNKHYDPRILDKFTEFSLIDDNHTYVKILSVINDFTMYGYIEKKILNIIP